MPNLYLYLCDDSRAYRVRRVATASTSDGNASATNKARLLDVQKAQEEMSVTLYLL
jgi:hypothetical protein